MKKKAGIVLFFILIVAAFFRLWHLSDIPPGVNRDEASIGYTALSLKETGKDEYGRSFPLSFESFGDWKLPLYIYTSIPFVSVFGLNELAVRLPSAVAGILSVYVLYLLALELTHQTKRIRSKEIFALLCSFSLAIMPWHIHISRVESEAIVAVLLLLLGMLLFFKALKQISLPLLILSSISFGLTYWTYHGNHLSTTLLLIGLFLFYSKDILRIKQSWIALAVGTVLFGSIVAVTAAADHTKLSGISIFGDPTVIHTQIELPRTQSGHPDSLLIKLRYNRLTYAVTTIVHNYMLSYGPEFLFHSGGGNHSHNIRGYGNLHPFDILFFIFGFFALVSLRAHKHWRVILWWFLIAGVAPAITKDAPHSNRMLMVVPAFAIAIAHGVYQLVSVKTVFVRWIGILALCLGYGISLLSYSTAYFSTFPKNEAIYWGYGYKKLTAVLESDQYKTHTVIMTKPQESPYIYMLFYTGYDPAAYQREATRYPISADGFTDVSHYGRFYFREIDWKKDMQQENTVIVTSPERVPNEYRDQIREGIILPDGQTQFVMLETYKKQTGDN